MSDDRHVRAVDLLDARARRYLGDGVYAAYGYGVWLTADRQDRVRLLAAGAEERTVRDRACASWRGGSG